MKARICISSPPDREELVAEVFFDDEQFAEVNQERTEFEVEIYPRQNGQPWAVPLDFLAATLADARARLCNATSPPPTPDSERQAPRG